MGNYNPRQITQMRWRYAKNLEKFIKGQFILYDIDFSSSDSLNFDTTPEAKELAKTIKYCYNNQIPLTIYDSNNDWVFISYFFENETTVHLINPRPDSTQEISIKVYENRIETTFVYEEFVSSDNVKSVFNQSIIGTGNITLFRHKLELAYNTTSGSPGEVYLDWLSTSNLNVDSLQDLQTLLKVSRNDTTDSNYLGYNSYSTFGITFSHSTGVFKIEDEYDTYNVTGVSDKVTTL